jgi:hypothetical protein
MKSNTCIPPHSISSRGWMIFASEQDREIAWNEARLNSDEKLKESLGRSSLDLPSFREAVEVRFIGAKFGKDLRSDELNQSFQLRLVADNFGYVLANVRELFLSGVVTHCVLDLAVPGGGVSSVSGERQCGPAGYSRAGLRFKIKQSGCIRLGLTTCCASLNYEGSTKTNAHRKRTAPCRSLAVSGYRPTLGGCKSRQKLRAARSGFERVRRLRQGSVQKIERRRRDQVYSAQRLSAPTGAIETIVK